MINLPRSRARREHIERELQKARLPHAFVHAIDGTELTPEERSRLVDEREVGRFPNWLTPGAIGCALSHREAYRAILAAGADLGLVLEDDVVLPDSFSELLGAIAGGMRAAEVVLLNWRAFGSCRFSAERAMSLPNGCRVLYPMDPSKVVSASAYLVTREACEKLVEHTIPVRAAADAWHVFLDSGALGRIRCVVPSAVGLRSEFKSSIDYLPAQSRRQRAARAVERRRIFPVFQTLWLLRAIRVRRMSRYEIVTEPPPAELTTDVDADGARS